MGRTFLDFNCREERRRLIDVLAAAVWGSFLSLKRRFELGSVGRGLFEALYFLGAALALVVLGHPVMAAPLLATEAGDQIALRRFH